MGGTRWSDGDWATHTASTSTKTRAEIFTSSHLVDALNPLKFTVRESCDSAANPNSNPIIIASDVTGSMGELAEQIIKTDLGKVMSEIYDRKPVADPHILCAAIGDTYFDEAPFQATQFEASIALAEQMKSFYIEGGGGGNAGESYLTAWYFAAYRTKCDAMIKRGRKGYLFTVGDEAPLPLLPKEHVKRCFGDDVEADLRAADLLALLTPNWHVFHLIVKPVAHQPVVKAWRDLLGQNAMQVSDPTKMGEVIVSAMQVIEGEDIAKVTGSWSGDTSIVVRDAVGSLAKSGATGGVTAL